MNTPYPARYKDRFGEERITILNDGETLTLDEYIGKRFTFFADLDGLPLELYER